MAGYVKLDYTKILDELIFVDIVNKTLNCQSGGRTERRNVQRLESVAISANNTRLEGFLQLMCELLLLFCNYFMNLSLLAGFVALERTAKISDKVISVDIVNKGLIWCLSLTLRWPNNNSFTL